MLNHIDCCFKPSSGNYIYIYIHIYLCIYIDIDIDIGEHMDGTLASAIHVERQASLRLASHGTKDLLLGAQRT